MTVDVHIDEVVAGQGRRELRGLDELAMSILEKIEINLAHFLPITAN